MANIAVDYDDTFTIDPAMWRRIIADMQASGHAVYCVSARRSTIESRVEVQSAMPDGVPVYLAYDMSKRAFMLALGIDIDVWIDDTPEAIPSELDIKARLTGQQIRREGRQIFRVGPFCG